KGVSLESNGSTRAFAWSEVVLVHLDGAEPKPRTGVVSEIDTAGGSTFFGTDATGDADHWHVTIDAGVAVSVPQADVVAVRWTGGAFVRMTTLPFVSKFVPRYPTDDPVLWERLFAARVDRTVGGCPLRIAGVSYPSG